LKPCLPHRFAHVSRRRRICRRQDGSEAANINAFTVAFVAEKHHAETDVEHGPAAARIK
jgi:hypothetical protein